MREEITLGEILAMQRELLDAHPEWSAVAPERGRDALLWMVEELGEVIAIIKKRGEAEIMEAPGTRAAFTEELCDVLMYFSKTMLCFGVDEGELAEAYRRKHAHNMGRDWQRDNDAFLER